MRKGRAPAAHRVVVLTVLLAGMVPAVNGQGLRDGLGVAYGSPPAPALTLTALDGATHDIAHYAGRVVVVNFWATWCPPCIEELPAIARMRARLVDRGLEVLGVNAGETAADVARFIADFQPRLVFPILLDPERSTFGAWSVRGLPRTFVVDKAGRVRYTAEGGRDMNSEHIRGLLGGLLNE